MNGIVAAVLAALRTSEFWVFASQVYIEASSSPVPDEFKVFASAYIVFRIVSKLARFIFPNPGSSDPAWFKNDRG